MAYFILKNQKAGPGGSRTITGQWLLENRGRRNEGMGVFINAENRVQLYHPDNVTLLINGKEVNASEIDGVQPEHLHTVIVKDVRDETAGPGRQKRYVQLFLNP
ncbi:hypothetical protein ACFPMF_18920 [Larkinella bovis]|uniref:Uncharacterized protein n=1 Tax=Larkinella bovis TaxID=683041 RepID=A0ABW0IGX5_9BACT